MSWQTEFSARGSPPASRYLEGDERHKAEAFRGVSLQAVNSARAIVADDAFLEILRLQGIQTLPAVVDCAGRRCPWGERAHR